jgi:hypothetical protein
MKASAANNRLNLYFNDEIRDALNKLPHQLFAYKGFQGRSLEIVTLPARQGHVGCGILSSPNKSAYNWRIVMQQSQKGSLMPQFKLTDVQLQLNGAGFKITVPDGIVMTAPKAAAKHIHIPDVVRKELDSSNGFITLGQLEDARKTINRFVDQNPGLCVLSIVGDKVQYMIASKED